MMKNWREARFEVCSSYGPGTGYFVAEVATSLPGALKAARRWRGLCWVQKQGRPAAKKR
jgi:hypothetical protein